MMMSEQADTDISSSSAVISSDDEIVHPISHKKRKRYKRSIHHGFSKKQYRYYHTINEESYGPIKENTSNRTSDDDSTPNLSESSPSLSDLTSISESSDDEVQTKDIPNFIPEEHLKYELLHEGSSHTLFSTYSLIMLFVVNHSLSRQAFSDLLLLIDCLLPSSKFSTSVYRIKEFLKRCLSLTEPVVHNYCQHCQSPLQIGQSCHNEICMRNNSKSMQFLDLQFKEQLAAFFKDESFYKMISRQELQARRSNIKDIIDGSKYKDVVKKHSQRPDRSDIHLTFTMNTDGVAVFSSSKKGHMWPVYLAINELPTRLRLSRKYLIPCFLHCEIEKPNMMTYLSPLMQTMRMLYSEGMEVMTANGSILKITGELLTTTLDLPARALVSNMKQFNGKSACIMCLDKGECPPGQSLSRYYPFKEDSQPRTHQSVLLDAQKASLDGEPVNGIKGASPLIALKYTNLPDIFCYRLDALCSSGSCQKFTDPLV